MDKATVKLQLESYRPQDANDPMFTEALREVAADPELAAWFEEMQRLDAVLSAKFQDVPVPPEIKSHILLGFHGAALPIPQSRPRVWVMAGSIAAILLLGLFSWHFSASRERPMDPLALQAISYTEQMPPLQFVCYDAAAVAGWINQQPGSQKIGLKLASPTASLSMAMIGSSVVDWNGRPVVMVCLQNGQRMAMLYILKGNAADDVPEGATQTVQKADWVVRTTKANGQVRLLTTKGGPKDLNFQTPL